MGQLRRDVWQANQLAPTLAMIERERETTRAVSLPLRTGISELRNQFVLGWEIVKNAAARTAVDAAGNPMLMNPAGLLVTLVQELVGEVKRFRQDQMSGQDDEKIRYSNQLFMKDIADIAGMAPVPGSAPQHGGPGIASMDDPIISP